MIMSRRIVLLVIIAYVHQVVNIPLSQNEKQIHFKTSANNILPINHGDQKLPVLIPLVPSQHVALVDTKMPNERKKKGPSIPLSLPLQHHLLVPTNLHVIPIHPNIHHSTIHATGVKLISNEHVKVPIVSHTFTHSSSNVTHPTPLIPILFPLHTHLLPLHDLTVIPLHRPVHNVEAKLSQYRTASDKRGNGQIQRTNDEEPMNKFRYFGGYGNGLEFGGHGAGHGFYAIGSWA